MCIACYIKAAADPEKWTETAKAIDAAANFGVLASNAVKLLRRIALDHPAVLEEHLTQLVSISASLNQAIQRGDIGNVPFMPYSLPRHIAGSLTCALVREFFEADMKCESDASGPLDAGPGHRQTSVH